MMMFGSCFNHMLCSIDLFLLTICRGSLIGHPVENLRVVLTDGASHAVDSSELAFKLAAIYAFRQVLLIPLFWPLGLIFSFCDAFSLRNIY